MSLSSLLNKTAVYKHLCLFDVPAAMQTDRLHRVKKCKTKLLLQVYKSSIL